MANTTLTQELRGYHEQLGHLLAQLASGALDVADLPPLLPKVVLETVRHLVQEEVFLLPIVRVRLEPRFADECAEHLQRMERAVRELAGTAPEDAGFSGVVQRLERAYAEHALWQEGELFPELERAAPGEQLRSLGQAVNPTAEAGPTHSHPTGFRPASEPWPAPRLVDDVAERLRSEAAARLRA